MLKSFVILSILALSLVNGLYEDQIGKFDWKQSFIGIAKSAHFGDGDKIAVTTEENTFAVLSAKNGEILSRQVYESDSRGEILLLAGNTAATGSHLTRDYDTITVSGRNPSIIRGWNAENSALEFEWSLNLLNADAAPNVMWFYNKHFLYHVIPVWGSHVEVAGYIANSGQSTKQTATKITTPWSRKENCLLVEQYFVCHVKNQVLVLDLIADGSNNIKTVAVDVSDAQIERVNGGLAAVRVGNQVVLLAEKTVVKTKMPNPSSVFAEASLGDNGALIEILNEEANVKIVTTDLQTNKQIEELSTTASYPKTLGAPKILAAKCRSGNQPICRLLVKSEDGALVLLQQGKIKWTREESLTNIDSVEFVDLTLSDAEGELEEELTNKNRDFYGAFVRRIAGQITHAKNIFLHVVGGGPAPSASQKAGLVRDDFGLHKIIIIVTKTGKVYGVDNLSGKFHWIKYLPHMQGFNEEQGLQLLVQRTSKYYPLPAQCAVIGKDKTTGNGVIFQFNPITGQSLNGGDGVTKLTYPIQQIALLPKLNEDSLKGLLLLDNNNHVHALPESTAKFADGLYLYTADRNTGAMSGYFVQFSNNKLQTIPTWKLHVGSIARQQKIIKIASKNPIEHVHSQGRVLADRSVLYKYLNPNLVAVVTQGIDPIHKYILNVHLVDVVSGAIIFSMTHRRAKGPVNIVHSENWLTYSFYNEKVRRTEITSIELYEGKTQANSTVWSSLGAPPLPLVERQTYIFPANVAVMKETITEKGITNKHVLFGISSGHILEMSWHLLDPRRPSTNPERAREEGLIPYIPELPIQQDAIVNYNQTIERLKGIHTAPSGLESTCLMIGYGLDLFVTRVAPSKTFDLLKEDFDYFLITAVLTALIVASYITKQLASRKLIKQAWK
ncbi:ER membrane protein complex subunit 1 [Culicoides brevitarsis]|uniref:ER membrane protein complex subunit 1 n=1 Tax=Culicoides brevitarsis TaxID=469753 RepID=UPI00307BB056